VSIPGVLPTTCTTWFQAEQACRLSGKRLLTERRRPRRARRSATVRGFAGGDRYGACAGAGGGVLRLLHFHPSSPSPWSGR
jgi:hypothetical protein